MYPHVTQFETRRQELERVLQTIPENEPAGPDHAVPRARLAPPRYKLALLTWAAAHAAAPEHVTRARTPRQD